MKKGYFEIEGGNSLFGKTQVYSAKNAVLPMLAAAMLTSEKVTIKNCPMISDIDNMFKIRELLSLETCWNGRDIEASGVVKNNHIPERLSSAMRSSIFMLGPLVTMTGEVKLHSPGGCKIGSRPIDIHLKGLEKMGAKITELSDGVLCKADRLVGAEIVLRYPSVGATENLISSAVLAHGETVIIGAAREPEVVSLCNMLTGMGARIWGAGTSVIKVTGVDGLYGTTTTPVADRIVAGTIVLATALVGGRVTIDNVNPAHLGALFAKLVSKHFVVLDKTCGVTVEGDGVVDPACVVSGPYPKFPTDLQPIFSAVLSYATGCSVVEERVFENRFSYVDELCKMGANIFVQKDKAYITGTSLHGADVVAKDLRGGAGLVVAGLRADGISRVGGVEYIDRGYENIEYLFSSLGAKIQRKKL
jgi:UDP-N-acetylglucosamine 1-carboxyvinyltransferase